MLQKTLECPLDCKEIKPVNPKGNQSWIFIGRTDAEAETPILWPPDVKSWLIGKKLWCWDRLKAGGEGGVTEDEMVGWHHWLNRHEFEQALGDGEGQGSLACCSPWGRKELDMTEQLNNNIPWVAFWFLNTLPADTTSVRRARNAISSPTRQRWTYYQQAAFLITL